MGFGYSRERGGRGFVKSLWAKPPTNSWDSSVGVEVAETEGVEKLLLARLSDSVVKRGFGVWVSIDDREEVAVSQLVDGKL